MEVLLVLSTILFLGIGLYIGKLIPKETEIIPSNFLSEDEECIIIGEERGEQDGKQLF